MHKYSVIIVVNGVSLCFVVESETRQDAINRVKSWYNNIKVELVSCQTVKINLDGKD